MYCNKVRKLKLFVDFDIYLSYDDNDNNEEVNKQTNKKKFFFYCIFILGFLIYNLNKFEINIKITRTKKKRREKKIWRTFNSFLFTIYILLSIKK